MQVFTQHGFTSAVDKGTGGLDVRSRDRQSIEAFCDLANVSRSRIEHGVGTDYEFRVRGVSRRAHARYLRAVSDGIDYSNFKNAIKASRGKVWGDALMRVWTAMLSVTPRNEHVRVTRDDAEWFDEWRARQSGGRPVASRWGDVEWDDDALEGARARADDDFEGEGSRSIHDMTESEWRALMEENPAGI